MLIEKELSADLREFRDNLKKLKAADEFSTFIGVPPPKTYLRLAQKVTIKHYPAAIREFSQIHYELDKAKGPTGSAVPHQDKLDNDLATWLADLKLDDGTVKDIRATCPKSVSGHQVNFQNITLYRCS